MPKDIPKNFFLIIENTVQMGRFALILSGSYANSAIDKSHNQMYTGLTYDCKRNSKIPAFMKPIQLRSKNNLFSFQWGNLGKTKPAKIELIDSSRNPAKLPLEHNTPYYLALYLKDKYYPLKLSEGSLVFIDESPNNNTVRLEVPADEDLKTNDVRTEAFLYVGDDLLVDHLHCNGTCKKLYLSVYEECSYTPNPNIKRYIVKPTCKPNCTGKKCTDDDGCGNVCGCPEGKICDPATGECVNPPLMPLCEANVPCGSRNGRCEGRCPPGSFCKRDVNGFARCVREDDNPAILGLIILIFIIIVLSIILGGLSINGSLRKKC